MSESFKDSYYGRMVYENEKVTVNGNRATVTGVDNNGNPYTNYFKKRYGRWTFNGYDGSDSGQVTSTKLKYKRNNNTTRPDNKEQQKRNLQNKGK